MSNSYYNSTFTAAIGTLARSSTLRAQFSLVEAGVTAMEAALAPKASPTFTGTSTFANLAYTGTMTGGTGIVNLGSGQFYKDASGNVGIGTSSIPAGRRLAVAGGAVRFDADAQLEWGGSTAGIYGNSAAGYVVLFTGTAARVTVDGGGNVGIGTTSPAAKLHVNGDVRLDVATSTSATAGAASALPAAPAGYLTINVSGTNYKVPFYQA